jgi:hypothetical protein
MDSAECRWGQVLQCHIPGLTYKDKKIKKGFTFMDNELPRINKKVLMVTSLGDDSEEKQYWLSRTPSDRFNAIEYNRRMVYGIDRTSSRLQRFLEITELS